MSGNRLVHIIGLDSSTMLTKPCPQSSSSFPNIKHATSTAGDAIDEMEGGARKLVLNLIIGFRCRNGGGRVYVIASFTIASFTRKRTLAEGCFTCKRAANQGFTDIFVMSKRD